METATTTPVKSNLQVVQQAYNDFLQGNIPEVINACTDDIVWGSYKNPDVPFAGTFYGKEGVQEFFNALARNVDYSNFEPKEFIQQDDTVVVLGHQTGTVKSTGKTFDHDWTMSFKMNNGKVQRYFAYVDSLDHAQAFK